MSTTLRKAALVGVVLAGAVGSSAQAAHERLVRVYGDLATAERVAVIVPGSDTTIATFENSVRRPGGAARALLAEAARLSPGAKVAVIAWLGYDSPAMLSVNAVTRGAAEEGAVALRRDLAALGARTTAPVTLICHSYGSAVCAGATGGSNTGGSNTGESNTGESNTGESGTGGSDTGGAGSRVTDLAVVGSPGLDLPAGTRVWAGRMTNDPVRLVPHVKLGPFGLGDDPMDPASGARIFATGAGGHSDYFRPGTASLRNLALITLGRVREVSRG
ncbi:alpha/beta hydrolase family protein [Nonomuraea sp. NBC_01738]|uniref:alpha/beta hydrolase n=1 Tax=Nonomuraea sp. NBC_01738 TaxID=2976003 RepID=UPI002E133F8D|nr:alpha/beta hydrolase family protein [Nonomuraea sp. NBC_01738]